MKKGFSLIEIVVSAALISIVVIAISALNLTNIKTNYISSENDNEFNIARGVCERFKSEGEAIPQKSIVTYINHLDDISNGISNLVLTHSYCESKDPEEIMNNNISEKRYGVIIETSLNNQLNVLKVTVISMNELKNTVVLTVTKPLETM